jgi:hypothetical protein
MADAAQGPIPGAPSTGKAWPSRAGERARSVGALHVQPDNARTMLARPIFARALSCHPLEL